MCAPQALGCWVCSLKRLCFCCHPSLSLSFPLCVSRSHLDSPTCFVCRLYRSPSPFCPSVFHYQCFIIIVGKSTRRNVGDCLIHSLSHPAQAMTLCYLRGKLVSAGSFENIIKLFMQRVWPLTITLLSEAGRGVCACMCVCASLCLCA